MTVRADERHARGLHHPEVLGAAIVDIIGQVASQVRGFVEPNTWLCGICGCLCVVGETCPKCRGDLMRGRLR